MRRKVFEANSATLLEDLFARVLIGELGLVDQDGYARIVPVNFAYAEGAIYFHGALAGEPGVRAVLSYEAVAEVLLEQARAFLERWLEGAEVRAHALSHEITTTGARLFSAIAEDRAKAAG